MTDKMELFLVRKMVKQNENYIYNQSKLHEISRVNNIKYIGGCHQPTMFVPELFIKSSVSTCNTINYQVKSLR